MDTETIRAAVNGYYNRKWVCIPLRPDGNGIPKIPFTPAWQQLTLNAAAIRGLPWDQGQGIGIVLGPTSDNLSIIDVDDTELWSQVFALLVRSHVKTRMVHTARRHGHVYFREERATAPETFKVRWQGREIGIELKGQGQQVAAPPTPGYTLAQDIPPLGVPTIRAAWDSIAAKLGLGSDLPRGTAGYPHPWTPEVKHDNRNKAMYIEAHKLRESGMPLEQALGILQVRFDTAYEKDEITWGECERTIRSAYSKGAERGLHQMGLRREVSW